MKHPVFDRCTIHAAEHEDLLAMDLRTYIDRHRDMIFPHGHNFHHFVLLTAGKGSFTIDFTNFTIEPYTAYFMIPGQIHTWDFENVPDGYIINFHADFFHSLLLEADYIHRFPFAEGVASNQVIRLTGSTRQQAKDLLAEICQLAAEPAKPENADFIAIMLLHLFFVLDRQTEKRQVGQLERRSIAGRQTLLRNFRILVEKHFREEKFPKFYADQLHISPNHLNTMCKTYLGKQAGEFIRERIVLEAKRMLINPGTVIATLAYELNFNDNSYFTKFFKKMEGMTPEEFRKKHGVTSRSDHA